jgi:hypothetical protein
MVSGHYPIGEGRSIVRQVTGRKDGSGPCEVSRPLPCTIPAKADLMKNPACEHLSAVSDVKRAERMECEECAKSGSRWVHLRTCQECGGTRCCDSSPNQHATKHAKASGHPVIASAEKGERWLYCYPDEAFAEY